MSMMENDSSLDAVYPLLAWDFHSLEVLNADMPLHFVMESPISSNSSTGYLQDAISEWNERCKRQRMIPLPYEQTTTTDSDNLIQNYWNWNFNGDPFGNGSSWSESTSVISDLALNSSMKSMDNGATQSLEKKPEEATTSEKERISSFPSPSSYKGSGSVSEGKETSVSRDPLSSEGGCAKRKKKGGKRVAYPFAVVKPGGVDGDVTLNDINERILMRPTRPVRHPVGEFASHPYVSADGPGLSGKAVVALTRIHTQGSGTITIIRTRG